jgi:hypothetical protein
MTPRGLARLQWSLLLPVTCLLGCDGVPLACADYFGFVTITLVDGANAPVPDAALTSVVTRTADTLVANPGGNSPLGLYSIADDSDRGKLSPFGDTIKLTVGRAITVVETTYVLAPGACHITKLSGPDTLLIP